MEQREQVATTAQARRLEHSNSTTRNNPMKACVSDKMTNQIALDTVDGEVASDFQVPLDEFLKEQ